MIDFIIIELTEIPKRIFRKLFRIESKKPWMRKRELLIIEEIVKKLQPQKVLEWGAGYSTLYFSNMTKVDKWLSVEHDQQWAQKVQELNGNGNISVVCVRPNHEVAPGSEQYHDYQDYIEYPGKSGMKFDYIYIDGRAREECLIKSKSLLAPGGIVVLHDANRKEYHRVFSQYKYQLLFTDKRVGDGGCWIGSNDDILDNFLDVSKYMRIWKYYKKLPVWV